MNKFYLRGETKDQNGQRYAAIVSVIGGEQPIKGEQLDIGLSELLLTKLSGYAGQVITELTKWDIAPA